MAKKKDIITDGEEKEYSPFTQIQDILNSESHKGTHYSSLTIEDIENHSDDFISTGSTRFDLMLGGGYRPGISLFFGDEETGKTAQGLVWAREWQNFYKEKAYVVMLDCECRLKDYKKQMSGIDLSPERFFHYKGNAGEKVFGFIENLVHNNPKGLKYFFILDSLDSMQRQEDKDKSFDDPTKIAGAAALNSLAFKRLSAPINCLGHHLYLCSQVRTQNMMGGRGDSAKPSGGKAPKFYGDIIGRMYKGWSDTFLMEGEKVIGNKTKIKIMKSYNEITNQDIDIPILYKHKGGVWREYEALMICLEWGWIDKKGAWFNFSEMMKEFAKKDNVFQDGLLEVKMQGEAKVLKFLTDNQDLIEYIFAKVKVLAL